MERLSRGRNAKLVKVHNRALVLRIIQQNDLISRKEISLRTGLTQATITKITNNLLDEELILEKGKDEQITSFGRKPISLTINKERYNVLSLHIGRFSISGAVCNLAGEIIYREEIFKKLLREKDTILVRQVINLIKELIRTCELHKHSILGIGISAPGTINSEKGIIIDYEGEKGSGSEVPFDWSNIHLRELVENEFGIPVFADNCSNVSALAEGWFGRGRGINNFVQYSVGVGIGAGVIIDGMLYRGEDDVVAEIGHITVDLHGAKCSCGNIGCLELYASFLNLLQSVKKKKLHISPIDVDLSDSKIIMEEFQDLFREANEGNKKAEGMIRELGTVLGIGAVSLANTFSPEYIIVSSNDVGASDLEIVVQEIRKVVETRAFSVISHKVKVVQSSLGEHIHLFGGIALVMQDFFNTLPAPKTEEEPVPHGT
jgi:predicted NBD/HSP70 family sugar kinase